MQILINNDAAELPPKVRRMIRWWLVEERREQPKQIQFLANIHGAWLFVVEFPSGFELANVVGTMLEDRSALVVTQRYLRKMSPVNGGKAQVVGLDTSEDPVLLVWDLAEGFACYGREADGFTRIFTVPIKPAKSMRLDE
jgi:hypothetical protein